MDVEVVGPENSSKNATRLSGLTGTSLVAIHFLLRTFRLSPHSSIALTYDFLCFVRGPLLDRACQQRGYEIVVENAVGIARSAVGVKGEFHRKGFRPLRRPDSVMA